MFVCDMLSHLHDFYWPLCSDKTHVLSSKSILQQQQLEIKWPLHTVKNNEGTFTHAGEQGYPHLCMAGRRDKINKQINRQRWLQNLTNL